MDGDDRYTKMQNEIDTLRKEMHTIKAPKKTKVKSDVPRKLSEYNIHVQKHLGEMKTAAAESGEKYDHKEAFKMAAASWAEGKASRGLKKVE